MNTTIDSTSIDDYDEPIWKSKANQSASNQIYSRKNQTKFLDESKAEDNRELFLNLFDLDPNDSVCNEKEFEKDLFADLQSQESKDKQTTAKTKSEKPKRKRTTKKKQQENPDFLNNQYQKDLNKKKQKLQELFEKSAVFQNLQALKDQPLNIRAVDCRGNVINRYEYYYDYEKDKHDIVKISDDERDNSKDRLDETDDDEILNYDKQNNNLNEKNDKQKNKTIEKSTSRSSKNKSLNDKSMNEKSINDKSKKSKSVNKSISKSSNNQSSRNLKRKSTFDDKVSITDDESMNDNSITDKTSNDKSKRNLKRKSTVNDTQLDQIQRPKRNRKTVNYSEN